ncbi:hypothetical protein ACQJBY_070171 [Aegilops geniculata]
MEEEQERVGGLHAEPAASGMRPPPSRRCAGAVCRHCRSCVFQVYPADRRGPLVPDKPTGVACSRARIVALVSLFSHSACLR